MAWAVLAIIGAIVLYAWASSSENMSTVLTQRISQAIATAEGFFHPSGATVPQRANNPGNLKTGDIGLGEIGGKTVFASVEDGWAALEHQVDLMLNGESAYYSPDMTIRQIAQRYTGGDNADAWATIVASQLGVTTDTRLGEVS